MFFVYWGIRESSVIFDIRQQGIPYSFDLAEKSL